MPKFGIIFAVDSNNGFAKNGKLPWNHPEDLAYFKAITLNQTIVMGSKTFQSIGRPLPFRRNIVMSRSAPQGSLPNQCDSFESLFKILEEDEFVWIIGGIDLIIKFSNQYSELISKVSISCISGTHDVDQVFPFENLNFGYCTSLCTTFRLSENVYVKYYTSTEYSDCGLDSDYLKIMKSILYKPLPQQTRNAMTRSIFGETLRINNIHDNFPILNTKRIYWKGVVEELLFFLAGLTDTTELQKRRVNIWKGNTCKEFLTKTGKEYYSEGDMGPMYGFQLRHFNASYSTCNDTYTGKGLDQVRNVINLLVNDPLSRRILMTTYNPTQAEAGVLYPCHGLVTQFNVDPEDRKISLATYQRSADWFLGVPFNISSYALLLYIIVQEVNNLNVLKNPSSQKYIPGDLILNFGDVHLYTDHLLPALEQLSRIPKSDIGVTLKMPSELGLLNKTGSEFWNSFSSDDFVLTNYNPQPAIKADMIA